MDCHDCDKKINSSISISISSANLTIPLLHFCASCFLKNAGVNYLKEMWNVAEQYVEDEYIKKEIVEEFKKHD